MNSNMKATIKTMKENVASISKLDRESYFSRKKPG